MPPIPALLHIHTTWAESNKRRLGGIDCLIWEKQLIVGHHRETMLQLYESVDANSRDSIFDVLAVENLKNADEGGYLRVNMHVGWAGLGVHIFTYLITVTVLTLLGNILLNVKQHVNCVAPKVDYKALSSWYTSLKKHKSIIR